MIIEILPRPVLFFSLKVIGFESVLCSGPVRIPGGRIERTENPTRLAKDFNIDRYLDDQMVRGIALVSLARPPEKRHLLKSNFKSGRYLRFALVTGISSVPISGAVTETATPRVV